MRPPLGAMRAKIDFLADSAESEMKQSGSAKTIVPTSCWLEVSREIDQKVVGVWAFRVHENVNIDGVLGIIMPVWKDSQKAVAIRLAQVVRIHVHDVRSAKAGRNRLLSDAESEFTES